MYDYAYRGYTLERYRSRGIFVRWCAAAMLRPTRRMLNELQLLQGWFRQRLSHMLNVCSKLGKGLAKGCARLLCPRLDLSGRVVVDLMNSELLR